VAGSSANSRPAPGSNPSQRAASTRRTCPSAKTKASPAAARSSAITRSTRSPTCAAVSPSGTPSRQSVQPGRSLRMSIVVPRRRRSPTPSAHPAAPPHSPRPARRHVSLARASGLVRTSAKRCSRSSTPRACASSRPRSVRGMSVRPVCFPARLHTVSPCRTTTITAGRVDIAATGCRGCLECRSTSARGCTPRPIWGQVLGTGSRSFRDLQSSSREGCVRKPKRRNCRHNAVTSAVPLTPSRSANPPW